MRRLREHWPEYLIELLGLTWTTFASFGISWLIWPAVSPVGRHWIHPELTRRALIGLGASAALVLFIYTRWGQRSGAHLNPAFTLAFFVLGKLEAADALFYVLAQFVGSALGAALFVPTKVKLAGRPASAELILTPGLTGAVGAFGLEVVLTFVMFLFALLVMNSRLHRYTSLVLGAGLSLVALVASPTQGAGLNCARGFAVALLAGKWTFFWIDLLATPIGAVAAALFYARTLGRPVFCAKFYHPPHNVRCLFRCGYRELGIEPWQVGRLQRHIEGE